MCNKTDAKIQGAIVGTAKATIKGLISSIPIVGNILGNLIFEVAGSIQQANLELAIKQINNRLDALNESKISKEWFESEEALELIKQLVDKIQYEPDKKKIQKLADVYVNSGKLEHVSDENKFFILDIVKKISTTQSNLLVSLKEIKVTTNTFSSGGLRRTMTARFLKDFFENLASKIDKNSNEWVAILRYDQSKKTQEIDHEKILLDFDILESYNLIKKSAIGENLGLTITRLGDIVLSYLEL